MLCLSHAASETINQILAAGRWTSQRMQLLATLYTGSLYFYSRTHFNACTWCQFCVCMFGGEGGYLKESVGFPHRTLIGWPRCKITRPVGVRIIWVRKEVIRLGRPRPTSGLVVDSLDITAGRRVKQVDSAGQLVSVAYHFIHVFKIHVSFSAQNWKGRKIELILN